MFDDLRDLYQEVILDHGRKPRISAGWRMPTALPAATIRCAAIGWSCS
ncbi:hypothetical protein ACFQU2_02780 [Siccirubricoccus deserti]